DDDACRGAHHRVSLFVVIAVLSPAWYVCRGGAECLISTRDSTGWNRPSVPSPGSPASWHVKTMPSFKDSPQTVLCFARRFVRSTVSSRSPASRSSESSDKSNRSTDTSERSTDRSETLTDRSETLRDRSETLTDRSERSTA